MFINRFYCLLFCITLVSPGLLRSQSEVKLSMKLSIVYQQPGEKKDTIELEGEAAEAFDIPAFLARHAQSTIHLNGSYAWDQQSVHFGYDSKLYSEESKMCKQFCPVVKYIGRAPFFGLATETRENFEGEEIIRVIEGSAAEQAGLLAGDIILYINDIEIRSGCDLTKEVANFTEIGDTIVVDIDRDGTYQTFQVVIGFKIKKIIMWQPCCGATGEDMLLTSDLHLFPNPTADFAQFQFSSSLKQPFQFFLSDVTGRVLLEQRIKDFNGLHQGQLDLTKFASGLYFLTVVQGNQRISKRLVLQKL